MPHEDRRISFDYAETYKAMFALCVQKKVLQPCVGSIAAITFKAGDDNSVVRKVCQWSAGGGGDEGIQPGLPGGGAVAVLPDLQYSGAEKSHEIGGTAR